MPFSLTPRVCAAEKPIDGQTIDAGGIAQWHTEPDWRGQSLVRNHHLLGERFLTGEEIENCTVLAIYVGSEYDDEWSILFDWTSPESRYVTNFFWAEMWFDHVDEQIHGLVRNCRNPNERFIYGPEPSLPYHFRMNASRTVDDLALQIDQTEWEGRTIPSPGLDLNAERARSREYKRTYAEHCRTAVAMALHPRLGSESPLGRLEADLLSRICCE